MSEYKFGKFIKTWRPGTSNTITFIVTEDCNLRCKYCYITHKASDRKMPFSVAKQFIDYIFATDKFNKEEAVILEFIGGEPLLETELVDQIADYFKMVAYSYRHSWYWNYRISISTNGLNYSEAIVQNFIKKNRGKLSIGITIDGNKEKHDLQRVFPDGSGSYDIVKKSIPLWISQTGGYTKVTFASADLKLLCDSIISLWDTGILEVAANVVFENVWQEGDDIIFEDQLIRLADYVLSNRLYDKVLCTLFDENIGGFVMDEELNNTYCGAGKMIAIGPDGKLFPCLRYKDYSLNNHEEWVVGNVETGIDLEKVRPFVVVTTRTQSDEECIHCDVAKGCGTCMGNGYDEATTATNFSRTKYICKMHKARVRANNYYFAKLYNTFGIERESGGVKQRKLYFLLSDDYVSFCQYSNKSVSTKTMDNATINAGLRFAHQNFLKPVFVHSNSLETFNEHENYSAYLIDHILPLKAFTSLPHLSTNCCFSISSEDVDLVVDSLSVCILTISCEQIADLFSVVSKLFLKVKRIELHVQNLSKAFDFELYKHQLTQIKDFLLTKNQASDQSYELNLITDVIKLQQHQNCSAGDHAFFLAPDEKIYTCGAFYSTATVQSIGDLSTGFSRFWDARLYTHDYNPLCAECTAFHCSNCRYLNKTGTNEISVSPSYQCKKSNLERTIAQQYQTQLYYREAEYSTEEIVLDPIAKIMSGHTVKSGYYKL